MLYYKGQILQIKSMIVIQRADKGADPHRAGYYSSVLKVEEMARKEDKDNFIDVVLKR